MLQETDQKVHKVPLESTAVSPNTRESNQNSNHNNKTGAQLLNEFPLCYSNQQGTIRTHSKERIQQPRAMPNRTLSVRRCPPVTTWVVLSQTRSTTEKPPSVFTTWLTMCCFLREEDRLPSNQCQIGYIYFLLLGNRL